MNEGENMKEKFKAEFIRSKTFIYKVGEEYYCMGMDVFRKCTEEERQLYDEFNTEFKSVASKKTNVKKLLEIFNAIVKKIEVDHSTEKEKKAKTEIEMSLDSWSKEEIESIFEQRDRFKTVLTYKDIDDYDKIEYRG